MKAARSSTTRVRAAFVRARAELPETRAPHEEEVHGAQQEDAIRTHHGLVGPDRSANEGSPAQSHPMLVLSSGARAPTR